MSNIGVCITLVFVCNRSPCGLVAPLVNFDPVVFIERVVSEFLHGLHVIGH